MITKSVNKQLCFIPIIALFLLTTAVTSGYAVSSGEKWAFQSIEHNNDGSWFVVGGVTTLSDDGTGTTAYHYNSNGSLGSNSENFTYSTTLNPDGSITMTNIFSDRTQMSRCVLSDDRKMIICDGTADTSKQTMQINVKMDEFKTYSNTDWNGDYYVIGYEHNANYEAPPNGNGRNMAISSINTADGNGTYTYFGTANSDGTIWYDDESQDLRSYSVSPDGSFVIGNGGVKGYLSGENTFGLISSPGITDKWASYFSMKRGDKAYSTADLEGTWAIAGFGDNRGSIFSADFASLTCNAQGNCAYYSKRQSNGEINYNLSNVKISVAPDGSFGKSFDKTNPKYAAAVGNYGNTIIVNMSLQKSDPDHRQIFIGVRCSDCSNLPGLHPDLVVRSVSNPPAQKKRGGSFNIKDKIINRGNTSIPSTTITSYYLSRNKSWDKDDALLLGSRIIPELEIGAVSGGKEPTKLIIPTETGTGLYYLIACADDMGSVEELNEDNNCRRSKRKIRVK